MAWIESHASLARHPKVTRLARTLECEKPTAIGYLHLLWWFALEFAFDGDLSKFSNEELAAACEWVGNADVFAEALQSCGWIDPDGSLHDWSTYTGKLAAKREQNKERMRAVRARAKHVPTTPTDAKALIECAARSPHVASTCAPTVPYRTVPTDKLPSAAPIGPSSTDGIKQPANRPQPPALSPAPVSDSPPDSPENPASWANWTVFAEALRLDGWLDESEVRAVLKTLRRRCQDDGVIPTDLTLQRWLALAMQARHRAAGGMEFESKVGWLLYSIDQEHSVSDHRLRTARTLMDQTAREAMPERLLSIASALAAAWSAKGGAA